MSDVEIVFNVGDPVLITQDDDDFKDGTIAGEAFEKASRRFIYLHKELDKQTKPEGYLADGKYYLVTIDGKDTEVEASKILKGNLGGNNKAVFSMSIFASR
ncbi:hypothetical protein TWF281_003144 [Arthrobotrys megalospora]